MRRKDELFGSDEVAPAVDAGAGVLGLPFTHTEGDAEEEECCPFKSRSFALSVG